MPVEVGRHEVRLNSSGKYSKKMLYISFTSAIFLSCCIAQWSLVYFDVLLHSAFEKIFRPQSFHHQQPTVR